MLDRSAVGLAFTSKTTGAVAEGLVRCSVEKPRHDVPPPLRANRGFCASLLVVVRTVRPGGGNRRDLHHCARGRVGDAQQGIFPAVSTLWLRFCHGHFHRLSASGRAHLQTVQRLEGCRSADRLLLSGAFSLPADAHVLAVAGAMAVSARRYELEAAEAAGHGIGGSVSQRSCGANADPTCGSEKRPDRETSVEDSSSCGVVLIHISNDLEGHRPLES